ncbi:MAG: potassium efflux system protein [Desulforhopalus sp.]|jgi:potassium efflux system protein
MKFHIIAVSWLILTVTLLIGTWSTAAEDIDSPLPSSPERRVESSATDPLDLISMATELDNRSFNLEQEILALSDIAATQKSLTLMAKEAENLSRNLRLLKNKENYGYDQLFDIKAQFNQNADVLQDTIKSTNKAIHQTKFWKKDWEDEDTRWQQLQSSLSKQVSSATLEPTFAKVNNIISVSQDLIDNTLKPLLCQLQTAEVIRASQCSLELELDGLVSVLGDNLMLKTGRSMFSSNYYYLLKTGFQKELPESLARISLPDMQFVERQGWLIFIQILFTLVLSIGIFQQRHHLMEKEQWRFIAKRPLDAGIFVAAITTSSFYGSVPGTWRLLAQCVVIISLTRLVDVFVRKRHKRRRWLVYGLSVYLITTRLFAVFALPLALFRLFIFTTTLIGIFLGLQRSAASVRKKDGRLYTWALRLGTLLCLIICVAEMGGYSSLSAHLLESTLKTILIVLAGWMLMVILRGFLEMAVNNPTYKKIPFLQVKAPLLINRSALLTDLFAATLTVTFILVTWKVYSSPAEAMEAILSFGVNLGSRRITVGLTLTAATLLYCAFLISWAAQAILMQGLFTRGQLQAGVRISMARLVHYGFVFLGLLLALVTMGVQLRDFTLIAGALGIGIGFGLQGIVHNFVSGLILLFERPIKVGDNIELDKKRVVIKKIGLRATLVQTLDRSEIVVPNSDLTSNKVTNWTLSDRCARIRIPVGVAYGSDVPMVMKTLLETGQEHVQVATHPAPQVLFMQFGESSLDFELRIWISEIDTLVQTRSELYQEIDRKFRSLAIKIPFPQQDLHMHVVDKPTPGAEEEASLE